MQAQDWVTHLLHELQAQEGMRSAPSGSSQSQPLTSCLNGVRGPVLPIHAHQAGSWDYIASSSCCNAPEVGASLQWVR